MLFFFFFLVGFTVSGLLSSPFFPNWGQSPRPHGLDYFQRLCIDNLGLSAVCREPGKHTAGSDSPTVSILVCDSE